MNITFSLEYPASKQSRQSNPIYIRCTLHRKHKRIHTGLSVGREYWNKQKKEVRKSHPQAVAYNKILQSKMNNILEAYRHLLQSGKEVSLHHLCEALQGEQAVAFVDFAVKTKLSEIKAGNKMGTYRRYETVLRKFTAFAGDSISVQEINYPLLKKYENYLLSQKKNARDTVSSNLSVLRTILNEAIRHDVYKGRNPFDHFSLKYTNHSKEKLTLDELNRLMQAQLPAIPSLHLARDFFLACFLAQGSRAGDMLTLTKDNLQQGYLVFTQQKTGVKMKIPLTAPLQKIFEQYSAKERPFLFPLFMNVKEVNERAINSKITYLNKYLKEVCKYAGILKKVSTHVARHTFTDLALEVSGGNIYQVQQSLGHKSVRTTELYARNRVNYKESKLVEDVVGLFG